MADSNTVLDSPQYIAAQTALDVVYDSMRKMGRMKHVKMSPYPSGQSEYSTVLVADLLNKRRNIIGSVRFFIDVPADGYDVKITVDWTRNAMGFWYRDDIKLIGAVDYPEFVDYKTISMFLKPVEWTADGSVRVKSMNRGHYKKIRKNKTRDKVILSGLIHGGI